MTTVVSAAPNRTTLVARVDGLRKHPAVDKWDLLTLRVVSVAPVEGYREMLNARAGDRVEVAIDREWLPAAVDPVGRTVRLSATVAGPGVVKVAYDDPPIRILPN